jgi:hypothetical protein
VREVSPVVAEDGQDVSFLQRQRIGYCDGMLQLPSGRLDEGETAADSRRGAHKSVQSLEKQIREWNDHPRPFVWKKTAEEILDSLARYLQRISGAGH